MTTRYAARVFGTAAIFNVLVGAGILLAPALGLPVMGVAPPGHPIFLRLGAGLIVLLGIGYYLTARNPGRNRDLMLLGGLGKLFVLPLMLSAWRQGQVGFPAVLGGAGDLVFALLFFDIMRRMRGVAGGA